MALLLTLMNAPSISLLLLALLSLTGCKPEEPQKPAAWAATPHEKWPQMVLTNAARFKGHTSLNGASSFLVQLKSGEVVAATARHLLGDAGGVKPEVKPADFNASLDSWFMHPRTRPDEVVKVRSLASQPDPRPGFDWVLFHIEGTGESVATPLTLRRTRVKAGETVHLIGVSYAEPTVAQKIYSGVVTERRGDRFRYRITPYVNIRGFSGAPIVDDDGLLVGVMTVWFANPRMEGDLWMEAGGEDAVSAAAILPAGS